MSHARKALITGVIARGFGYVNMAPWIVGLGLSQIGEFSFVLARSGLAAGAIAQYWHKNQFGHVAGRLYIALCAAAIGLPVPPLIRSGKPMNLKRPLPMSLSRLTSPSMWVKPKSRQT